MKINGAWYINQLPTCIILELESGDLKMVYTTPFRELSEKDLLAYKGYHPRKRKGQPVPSYLYRFYGLEKNEESLSEVVHVRLSPSEKAKVETYGANLDDKKTVSEVVREFIKTL